MKITGVAMALLFFFGMAGQLLGSYIFIGYAQVPGESIGLTTLYKYYAMSNGAVLQHSWPYRIGLAVSVLLPLVILLVVLAAVFIKPKRELHGSARFALDGEISKIGLLDKKYKEPDILVGQYKGQYLRWAGKQFAFLAAPTRSGKGVGIVIPNCLHYRDSLVVFDPKLENFKITSGFRAAHGHEVFLFNPSTKDFKSHGWNPLSYVSRDPVFSTGGAFNIANILYSTSSNESGNSRFFNEMAQKLFVGLCLYLIETEKETKIVPSLAAMLKLSTPENGMALGDWIKEEVLRPDLSPECKNNLLSFAGNSGQTASGILSSFLAPLSVFSDPIVSAITSKDDFDLRDVRKKKMSIYIGILPNDIAKFARLINLFFSQLISENTQELPENNPDLKYQCLLLIDEFAALGKVDIIEKGVAYIAGYNIRILAIFQSMSQLNSLYSKDGARTLSTNFECQIIYPPRDNEDAKEYSEIIGYETFKSRSFSKSQGGIGNKSQSTSDQKRPVLLPQEVKTLPTTDCIVCLTGIQPIYATKIVYYKDPVFQARLGYTTPGIPTIKVERFVPVTDDTAAVNTIEPDELSGVENTEQILKAVISALCPKNADTALIMEVKQAVEKAYSEMGLAAFKSLYTV
ncbi:type IV secretory system conjugative DNA transfer family protein [Acinetobacter sp.]|uniref:type IV secretory system conjugative DNA transfer family protein n=1 Tax=Acinetobacter sp. TaxID=472 RepID=UPI003CFEF94A